MQKQDIQRNKAKHLLFLCMLTLLICVYSGLTHAQDTVENAPTSGGIQLPSNIGDAISFNPANPGNVQVNPGQLAEVLGVNPGDLVSGLGIDPGQLGGLVSMDPGQLAGALGVDPTDLAGALGVNPGDLIPGLPGLPGIPGLPGVPGLGGGAFNCSLIASCPEVEVLHRETRRQIKRFIDQDFSRHKNWMTTDFWEDHLLPALMEMTSQMSTTQMETVEQQSTLTDAQIAAETVNSARQVTAEAQRRYQVDEPEGLCTSISTTVDMNATEEDSYVAVTQAADAVLASGANRAGTGSAPQIYNSQQIEFICATHDPNSASLDAMCTSYFEARDSGGENAAVQFSELLNSNNIPVSLTDGEATPEQRTLVRTVQNMYGRPFPPVNERTARSVMPTLMEARGHIAQNNLAARCYLNTFADTMTSEDAEQSPQMVAHLQGLGFTDEQIGDMGNSLHTQMQNAKYRVNNPDYNIGLIGTRENTLREGLFVQSLQTSSLFNILEQQHCSELMSALMLSNTLNGVRGDLSGRIRTLQAQYDMNKGQTKYAQTEGVK